MADGGPPPDNIANGSGDPHTPSMEERVGALEQGYGEIRAVLERLEPMIVTIVDRTARNEADMAAMKAEIGTVRSELGTMKADLGTMRSDLGTMKADLGTVRSELGMVTSQVGLMQSKVERIEQRISRTREDVMEIKGMISQMPATWQLVAMIFGIFAASFALLRIGMPHP